MSKIATIWVRYEPIEPDLVPKYQTEGSAGCDLVSSEDVVIPARGRALVGTGLKLEIPTGFEGQVRPRSGLAVKSGITVLNAPGTIDSDYRGEVKVVLFNTTDTDYSVKRGDRVAQLVFSQTFRAIFQASDDLTATQRAEGGFGSTGGA